MKKFLLRTLVTFSIIFIFLFGITMIIEYKNKDQLKSKVNVQIKIDSSGKIEVPSTPNKVKANYVFSEFYLYADIAITLATPILFYKFGGIDLIKKRTFKYKFVEGLVLTIFYSIFSEIIIFSKVLFSSFYRGKLVGLCSYSLLGFLQHYFLDNLLSYLVVIPVLALIYSVYLTRKRWYLVVGVLSIIFMITSNYLFPYLDEIQNTVVPMENCELKTKINNLAEKAGIKNLDIRVVKKSNETSSMNAYMTGVGNSRRIVFWDTTLNGLNDDEILSVAAHEMGHYKLNHIVKSMVLSSVGIIALVIFLDLIMKKYKGEDYREIEYIPYVIFIVNLIMLLATPIETAYSRKIEIEADTFAIETTGDAYTNGELEIKFINSNLTPIDVKGPYKWFNYDHPTVKDRIELSNKYLLGNK